MSNYVNVREVYKSSVTEGGGEDIQEKVERVNDKVTKMSRLMCLFDINFV